MQLIGCFAWCHFVPHEQPWQNSILTRLVHKDTPQVYHNFINFVLRLPDLLRNAFEEKDGMPTTFKSKSPYFVYDSSCLLKAKLFVSKVVRRFALTCAFFWQQYRSFEQKIWIWTNVLKTWEIWSSGSSRPVPKVRRSVSILGTLVTCYCENCWRAFTH